MNLKADYSILFSSSMKIGKVYVIKAYTSQS